MTLALQYVFLATRCYRSRVFKLNIVCVFSAEALECISLEIFFKEWSGGRPRESQGVPTNAFLQLPNKQCFIPV